MQRIAEVWNLCGMWKECGLAVLSQIYLKCMPTGVRGRGGESKLAILSSNLIKALRSHPGGRGRECVDGMSPGMRNGRNDEMECGMDWVQD